MHVCGLIVLDPSTMPDAVLVRRDARRDRQPGARRARVHPQAAQGPAQARPPDLGQGPALRHRPARAPARAAAAGRVRRAGRAGRAPRRAAARPVPPAVGDVGDRGVRRRQDRRLLEDAPRDGRRRLRVQPDLAPVQPRGRRAAARGRRQRRRSAATPRELELLGRGRGQQPDQAGRRRPAAHAVGRAARQDPRPGPRRAPPWPRRSRRRGRRSTAPSPVTARSASPT